MKSDEINDFAVGEATEDSIFFDKNQVTWTNTMIISDVKRTTHRQNTTFANHSLTSVWVDLKIIQTSWLYIVAKNWPWKVPFHCCPLCTQFFFFNNRLSMLSSSECLFS